MKIKAVSGGKTIGARQCLKETQEDKNLADFLQSEIVMTQHCGTDIAWSWLGFLKEPILIEVRCPKCGVMITR